MPVVIIEAAACTIALITLGFLGGYWFCRHRLRTTSRHEDGHTPCAGKPAVHGRATAQPTTGAMYGASEEQLGPAAFSPSASVLELADDNAASTSSLLAGNSGNFATNECDRTVFLWQVRQRIAERKRGGAIFSVMLVRMNECGHIVATQGRSAADSALQATRRLLSANMREVDLLGHFGGSCYALLLPRAGISGAEIVAQRLREAASRCEIPTKFGSLEPTLSIGIAELSEGDDAAGLIQRSEAAMLADGKSRASCRDEPWPEAAAAAP